MYDRLDNNLLNKKCETKEESNGLYNLLLLSLLMTILSCILIKTCGYGIDKAIRNQDRMLCESALISGNKQYLEKCQCYYQTDDIGCLQEGGE